MFPETPPPNRVDPDVFEPPPPNRPPPGVEAAPGVVVGVLEAPPNKLPEAGLFAPPPNRPPPADEGAAGVAAAAPNNEGPEEDVGVAPLPPKRDEVAGLGVVLAFPATLPNKPPPDD